jgi:hypothetical protein
MKQPLQPSVRVENLEPLANHRILIIFGEAV